MIYTVTTSRIVKGDLRNMLKAIIFMRSNIGLNNKLLSASFSYSFISYYLKGYSCKYLALHFVLEDSLMTK